MDSARLAQSFNRVGQHLIKAGHRIVIRRARELITVGDLSEAQRFLHDAAQRLADPQLQDLHEALTRWRSARLSVPELCAQPAWRDGAAAEDRLSALISAATVGSLPELLAERAAQQLAQARGESLAPPAAPSAPSAGRHAIANLRGETSKAPEAVIEAPSQLTARALDLDDDFGTPAAIRDRDRGGFEDDFGVTGPLDLAPDQVDPLAATELLGDDTAALVRAATRTPPPPPRAPERDPFDGLAAAPTPPAPPAADPAASDMLVLPDDDGVGGFAHIPELHPPAGGPVSPPTPASAEGKRPSPLLLIALAVAALGGAAAWFFTR